MFVVVSDHILFLWIYLFSKIALAEVPSYICNDFSFLDKFFDDKKCQILLFFFFFIYLFVYFYSLCFL